jgi:hypothetical protein
MDTMEVNERDLGKALQESALLAHVKISVWDSVKSDRAAMEDVKRLNNAKGDVGKLMKNMLAGVDGPLKAVRSAYTAVRMRHYELTLPWVSNLASDRRTGPRLLPHPLFVRYLKEIGELKRAATDQLEVFLPLYPQMIDDAQPNLGGMYVKSDYPSVEEVRSKFMVYQDFEPIPDGAGFKGLPQNYLERLSVNLTRRQNVQKDQANKAMWEEARTRVEHLVDRLAEEDTKFKEASVRAVRELVTLLPGWNISGDTRVGEIAGDIDQMLTGIEAVDLRKDPLIRANVANEAKRVSEKLKKWGL